MSMPPIDFSEVIEHICSQDHRYDKTAYHFVRTGLDYTVNRATKRGDRASNHVSCKELLDGLREFALLQYGPMAHEVLTSWGIKQTEDFGEIVFNLIEVGVLGRHEKDNKEDFQKGYDFKEAFLNPFLPNSKVANEKRKTTRKRTTKPKPNDTETDPS